MSDAVQGAPAAHHSYPARGARVRLVVLLSLTLALVMAFSQIATVAAADTSAQPSKGSQAAVVLRLLKQAVGHPFRFGTEGPKYFDCSGLIYSVFKRAGLVNRIGGARRGATGYLNWARNHGLVSRNNPRVGDVIIWGKHGKVQHSGIYIGGGRAISALNRKLGVRNWPVRWIHMRIMGIIHVRITR